MPVWAGWEALQKPNHTASMPLLQDHTQKPNRVQDGPASYEGDQSQYLGERASSELDIRRSLHTKVSEESIRTELCEGPLLDSPRSSTPERIPEEATAVTDRAELIERLKRGESPTWFPSRHVSAERRYASSPCRQVLTVPPMCSSNLWSSNNRPSFDPQHELRARHPPQRFCRQ
jgi:hypothetical protein